jgi:NitT/TauT family transport system ATP-binding protein
VQPEISCERVRKVYGRGAAAFEAVNGATFSVQKGEFISLLGPSGCGKSTLLMMIAGLEPVTEGRIFAGGTVLDEPRSEIGIVFQDPTLLPWKTAWENIMFPIEMMGRSRSAHADRAKELLRLVGLADAADKRPSQLSGGMRQRVSLCRALIADPSILLMDEPFSALDAITRDDMNLVLLELWERYRKTVLFVTHSLSEAVFLSDRVVLMSARPGRIHRIFEIDLPRPRDRETRLTERFHQIVSELSRELYKVMS